MGEIENHTWHVTLAGRFGQYPPIDEAGFLAFARSPHTPRLHRLIFLKDAERVTDIVQYRFPSNLRRHHEHLTAFPEGFLVLGDALCSFNPVYGQGMSVAALQVRALQQLLTERGTEVQGLEGLALAFFPKAAECSSPIGRLHEEVTDDHKALCTAPRRASHPGDRPGDR